MRRDVDGDQRITSSPAGTRPALTLQADLLAAGDPGRDLDLDIFACGKVDAGLGALRRVGKRDRQRCMQVLPRAGRCLKILCLELRAETARTAAATCAKHSPQEIFKARAADTAAAAA